MDDKKIKQKLDVLLDKKRKGESLTNDERIFVFKHYNGFSDRKIRFIMGGSKPTTDSSDTLAV